MTDGCRKRPCQARVHALLDLLDGSTATQTLLQIDREVPGRHVCANEGNECEWVAVLGRR